MNNDKFYLCKRGNGIYKIGYVVDSILKWKSTGKRKKSEALIVLREFEQSSIQPIALKTLGSFKEQFLDYASVNFSNGTWSIYRTALTHLQHILGDLPMRSITAHHADIYKISRLQHKKQRSATDKVQPTTINCELRTLRAAFNTALRWKMINENPFKGLSMVPVPEAVPKYFTREDFQKLLNIIKESWLREVVILAVLTGMRRGEIVNLRWCDIDLNRKCLTIQSSATFKTKQGRRRTISLSDSALFLLEQKLGKGTSEYVFTLNDKPLYVDWVTHKFKDYVRDCKFAEGSLHFHSLRHSFASWLVQAGTTLYEIQKLLGHSTPKMSQVYSHLQPDSLHNTVNKIVINMN